MPTEVKERSKIPTSDHVERIIGSVRNILELTCAPSVALRRGENPSAVGMASTIAVSFSAMTRFPEILSVLEL